MKYLLSIFILISTLNADFIRVWGGIDALDKNIANNVHMWAMGKHFIPLVPNVRIEYTSMDYGFFNKVKHVQNIDTILYYNFLDNLLWLTLDVGLGSRVHKVEDILKVKDINILNSFKDFKPFVFLRARGEVPLTTVGFEVSGKYLNSVDTFLQDITVKADILISDLFLMNIDIEGGYKKYTYESNSKSIYIDEDRLFLGVSVKI
jgi:outer membrane protein